jgi:hypothetical protein
MSKKIILAIIYFLFEMTGLLFTVCTANVFLKYFEFSKYFKFSTEALLLTFIFLYLQNARKRDRD